MIEKNNVFHIGDKVKIKDGNFELFKNGEIVDVVKPNKITDEMPEICQYRVKWDNNIIYENMFGCCLELCEDGDSD